MKNLSVSVGVCFLAAIAFPALLNAQSQGFPYEAAAELFPNTPDSPELQTAQGSAQYAITALPRTEGAHAGATDSKELTTTSAAPAADTDDGFSEPAAYSEYRYARIQDNRAIGFDGPQHNGIVGFDFDSFYKTIVGFNFTYTNASLTTSNAGTNFSNSSNSYFFSTYAARNFDDWVNIGESMTYGRTDSNFLASGPGTFALSQSTSQDSCALSPFIGVAHTWGAFSFSSTPTYIWGYDHYNFAPAAPGGAPAAPAAKTLNQTFLLLNNFQYAVTDKLSLSLQANWTRLLTIQSVPTVTIPTIPAMGHQWMSFGARADYALNKSGNVFAAFEHDAFDTTFDDFRIRTGVSYNF